MSEITKTPKTEDVLDQLKSIADKLTPEQRKKAQDAGMFIPKSATGVLDGIRVWGYLCRQCGEVGVEFIGDTFEIVKADGTVVSVTPKHQREFPELSWMELQVVPPRDPNKPLPKHENGNLVHPIRQRNNPRCCQCGQQLRKNSHNGGLTKDNVVVLEFFRKAKEGDRMTHKDRYNRFLQQEQAARVEQAKK